MQVRQQIENFRKVKNDNQNSKEAENDKLIA